MDLLIDENKPSSNSPLEPKEAQSKGTSSRYTPVPVLLLKPVTEINNVKPDHTAFKPPDMKPMLGGIKTINRRGNIYKIRGLAYAHSSSSEEDTNDLNVVDRMINDLYSESLSMSSKASLRAERLRLLNISAIMFTIIAGAVIGILTLEGHTNRISLYIASALGFIITAIHTILSTFPIGKRGVLLKEDSNRLKKISRQLKVLQGSNISNIEKLQRLEEYYTEIDELDLIIFDNNAVTIPNNKTKNEDSDLDSERDSLYHSVSKDSKKRGFFGKRTDDSPTRQSFALFGENNKRSVLPITVQDVSTPGKANEDPVKGNNDNILSMMTDTA
ncbi:Hypothetical protein HVR_LOCUS1363 [uncultured virus]|nr:Hypothetical protein HVR_LOCUS1363 [uncultured virus]